MSKRLFWLSVGFVAGVVTVTKARAYVKANTPQSVRGTLFPDSSQNVAVATLAGLWRDFTTARESRERELNRRYQDVV
ncbi:hypothetical protein [uncultured Bifidobacterium sp.]|uniref:hypothetical protein n=1 Tax=uncultured Bifidobacterium sp. TaxID=165187 RepID=UPI00262CBE04|nr:hypothetical protein [uncultured Bifidobacterium sp.]